MGWMRIGIMPGVKISKTRMTPLHETNRKLSPRDLMNFKRDHLEGTELDMSKDVGAGPHGLPYRWRPLTWKVDGVTYFHERVTATQQTVFVRSANAQLVGQIPLVEFSGLGLMMLLQPFMFQYTVALIVSLKAMPKAMAICYPTRLHRLSGFLTGLPILHTFATTL